MFGGYVVIAILYLIIGLINPEMLIDTIICIFLFPAFFWGCMIVSLGYLWVQLIISVFILWFVPWYIPDFISMRRELTVVAGTNLFLQIAAIIVLPHLYPNIILDPFYRYKKWWELCIWTAYEFFDKFLSDVQKHDMAQLKKETWRNRF